MRSNVYIRADGGAAIGLGHLVRCVALAKMLQEEFKIYFVSKEIPLSIKDEIFDQGFLIKEINSEEEFFAILTGDEIVVLDHYELGSNYQKTIKVIGSKLVCIDDLHNQKFYADLIINHSPRVQPEDYCAQTYTKFALGPDYALLRPAFLKAAGRKRIIKEVEKVLICFGGSDFKNLTQEVLKVVEENDELKNITVILGAAYPHWESLKGVMKNNKKVRVLNSLNEEAMCKEILTADLAIIPASGILFEVIAGGCIPLVCHYADNQKELFNYYKEKESKLSFNALNFDKEELKIAIKNVLKGTDNVERGNIRKRIMASSTNNLMNFRTLKMMNRLEGPS